MTQSRCWHSYLMIVCIARTFIVVCVYMTELRESFFGGASKWIFLLKKLLFNDCIFFATLYAPDS